MTTSTHADRLLVMQHALGTRVQLGHREGFVQAIYTTWFPGCYTAGSQGQPAAHTRYTVQLAAGCADVPAGQLVNIY